MEREETLEKLENLTSERNQLKQTCKVSVRAWNFKIAFEIEEGIGKAGC